MATAPRDSIPASLLQNIISGLSAMGKNAKTAMTPSGMNLTTMGARPAQVSMGGPSVLGASTKAMPAPKKSQGIDLKSLKDMAAKIGSRAANTTGSFINAPVQAANSIGDTWNQMMSMPRPEMKGGPMTNQIAFNPFVQGALQTAASPVTEATRMASGMGVPNAQSLLRMIRPNVGNQPNNINIGDGMGVAQPMMSGLDGMPQVIYGPDGAQYYIDPATGEFIPINEPTNETFLESTLGGGVAPSPMFQYMPQSPEQLQVLQRLGIFPQSN